MNSSVWSVCAIRAVREKSGFEEFGAMFEGGSFNFWWSKQTFKKILKLLEGPY